MSLARCMCLTSKFLILQDSLKPLYSFLNMYRVCVLITWSVLIEASYHYPKPEMGTLGDYSQTEPRLIIRTLDYLDWVSTHVLA